MRTLGSMHILGLLALSFFAGAGICAGQDNKVEVRGVSLADLANTVKGLKGKVVVLDFWAFDCPACKRGFPHLVRLHERYAKDGLAVISVNLDDPRDKGRRKEALNFLKEQKAFFTNLAPDERQDLRMWAEQLKIDGIPVTDVYDREGKGAKRIEGLDTEALDEVVGRLLKK